MPKNLPSSSPIMPSSVSASFVTQMIFVSAFVYCAGSSTNSHTSLGVTPRTTSVPSPRIIVPSVRWWLRRYTRAARATKSRPSESHVDFDLSDQQRDLRDAARRYLEREAPIGYARAMMDDERGYRDDVWKQMAEQGWLALPLPTEYGGLGMGPIAIAILLAEMGRVVSPGPYLSTVLAGMAIADAGSDEQKSNYLPRIASGDLIAADSVGGAERVTEMAVEYAKTRTQFGRPIGSFQAVKHRAADMLVDVESLRSAVYYAAWASEREQPDASLATSMAKAFAADAYRRVAQGGIQIHGGIGFTWEHDMHLYFKRAKSNEAAFGDATFHRERVARLLSARV